METKFIWVVNFGDNDFDDLNCAFDNFKTAKEAVQTIFGKVSAVTLLGRILSWKMKTLKMNGQFIHLTMLVKMPAFWQILTLTSSQPLYLTILFLLIEKFGNPKSGFPFFIYLLEIIYIFI